ncbi:GTPase [Mangrovimonas sp. DI 80]|uniref:GTPase n=1 Tax=Mangrovimonas sp. DI 80 TaxID=1779330 RepID=UPI000975E81E|nr:GTPase [Mangrovimonas sp. DI 80]OMP32284.1 hypothetical protein BKM32_04325 [Mangrovimonas sp. DI 80]
MESKLDLKYNTLTNKLEELKEKTFSILKNYDKTETINELKDRLGNNSNRKELKVAFVGQYNAGKSTIISALTNDKNIRIDSNVATDESTEYAWNNIVITDTPGILAGKVEKHDHATKAELSSSDLVVYTLTSQLFDDVIFENFIDLAYTQNLKNKMLIAINKMSMEKGEFSELQKNYTESIKTVFKEKGYDFDFPVVFMDAFDFIEGSELDEEDLIEMSNFPEFIHTLNEFINTKGLIQQSFDTPIRILKDSLEKISIDETDPNFGLIIKKYENRVIKHKEELIKEVSFLYSDLKDKILSEGYSISGLIGEIEQEDFNKRQEKFNIILKEESSNTMYKIEELIAEKNKSLGVELSDIIADQEVVLYEKNLTSQFSSNQYGGNFKSSSYNGKIEILNSIKDQASKLTKFTGASNTSNIFARSAEVAGSTGHKTIYQAGKFIGYKFKPWEAVKITKNVGNVAKFAGPALSLLSAGLTIADAYKEEKALKKVVASKNQMNDSFHTISNDLVSSLNDKFQDYIKNNIDTLIEDYNNQKMEIIKTNEKNSDFLSKLNKLNTEYVDFIEVVNN